jgi:amino acid adenylation domain-containing protein
MQLSILQKFERWASVSPDAVAVVCEDRRVTYGQLKLTAEQVAHGLREAGVVSGCLVGVVLDRSPEMVAALLGIWKAAAAWIPIDPAAPAERIAFMLEDAAPRFLLTIKKLSPKAPISRVLYLEDLCARKRPSSLSRNAFSADDLAYVIYTSGSTGKPKGAKITHGGLANTILGVAQDLKLTPEDVVLAWSTIVFDVACLEMYLPLAAGASLYLTRNDAAREGGSTPEQIRRSAATVVFGTPTMYRLLLERGWRGDTAMQVIVGGEVLPLGLARTLAGACRTVWNQYGPTETTICATRAKIDINVEKITIGQPLPNVRVHLLDKNLQPVPKGSIGELYIGGAGVGLGYLNRPDLSREQFLPDPFAGSVQGAIYKSGDLALQLDNGDFEFLGRVDHQVKIRGYRIELGEIESALTRCESVQAVVVRAIELEPGDRRLVAFVVGDGTFISRWKEFLQQQLPYYMVPSEFVALRSFPTTASGKVDLRALDAMRLRSKSNDSIPQADPVDPMEARLTAIWEGVLKVNPVGLHEDFFALGGHSLLAARMLTQVEQWFGSRLPHSVLVENPTIHRLAAYLRQGSTGKWPAVVTIQSGSFLPPLFVAHGIGGSLLSFVDLAAEMGAQQTVYGLQLPVFIDPNQAGLRDVAANFVKQIRALQPRGPYHFAGHSSGGVIVYEMACQLTEQGETVGMLALLDCDPNTGKLVHRPFRDWKSLKASLRRAYAELKVRELGLIEQIDRRFSYYKFKISTWLAARSHRSGRTWLGQLWPDLAAEGYLALALREHELRSYPGDAILFLAQDEPGRDADPTSVWAGKILGECETRFVPGTHRSLLMRPQVATLAREISRSLTHSASGAMV